MPPGGKEALSGIVMFMRNFRLLREYVRYLLEKSEEVKDDLLTEPDDVEDREDDELDEFSAVGAIAGASTPVGTGPKHPGYDKLRKKQKKRK